MASKIDRIIREVLLKETNILSKPRQVTDWTANQVQSLTNAPKSNGFRDTFKGLIKFGMNPSQGLPYLPTISTNEKDDEKNNNQDTTKPTTNTGRTITPVPVPGQTTPTKNGQPAPTQKTYTLPMQDAHAVPYQTTRTTPTATASSVPYQTTKTTPTNQQRTAPVTDARQVKTESVKKDFFNLFNKINETKNYTDKF